MQYKYLEVVYYKDSAIVRCQRHNFKWLAFFNVKQNISSSRKCLNTLARPFECGLYLFKGNKYLSPALITLLKRKRANVDFWLDFWKKLPKVMKKVNVSYSRFCWNFCKTNVAKFLKHLQKIWNGFYFLPQENYFYFYRRNNDNCL